MVAEDAPPSTEIYSQLTAELQAEFGKVVIKKLRTLIGGCGELSVLAEYIAVMLQSNRPPDQIQSELQAFLQDQSVSFTDWLFEQLEQFGGAAEELEPRAPPVTAAAPLGPPPDAKGEAMLLRAVQDARQGVAESEVVPAPAKRKERREKGEGEKEKKSSTRNRHNRSRSRQRERSRARRRRGAAEAAVAKEDDEPGGDKDKKAVLTPNVRFLRDAYHSKNQGDEVAPIAVQEQPLPLPLPIDTRWSFRAEAAPMAWQGAAPTGPPAAVPPPAPRGPPQLQGAPPGYGPPPVQHGAAPYDHPAAAAAAYGAIPGGVPVSVPAPRPRFFQTRKWKVSRANTVVKVSEQLHSAEVQTLQVGEIVEQVAPPFKLQNGIVRVQIRHPSSPHFPNPIGWVTLDATAAGGPKFLEPGPEPMQKPQWRPPAGGGTWAPPAAAPYSWRPRAPLGAAVPSLAKLGRPPGQFGNGSFQNLTWTPNSGKSGEGEAITISG